jgi:hypothetical protein
MLIWPSKIEEWKNVMVGGAVHIEPSDTVHGNHTVLLEAINVSTPYLVGHPEQK